MRRALLEHFYEKGHSSDVHTPCRVANARGRVGRHRVDRSQRVDTCAGRFRVASGYVPDFKIIVRKEMLNHMCPRSIARSLDLRSQYDLKSNILVTSRYEIHRPMDCMQLLGATCFA